MERISVDINVVACSVSAVVTFCLTALFQCNQAVHILSASSMRTPANQICDQMAERTGLEDWIEKLPTESSSTLRLKASHHQLQELVSVIVENLIHKSVCFRGLTTSNVCQRIGKKQRCNQLRIHDLQLACTITRDVLPAFENLFFLLQSTEMDSTGLVTYQPIYITSESGPLHVLMYTLVSLKHHLGGLRKLEEQLL